MLLLVWKFTCKNKNDIFVKETDISGYIIVLSLWKVNAQTRSFKCSAACLSVIFVLLPGLIPFAYEWHAWWILDKYVYINMSYTQLSDYNVYESVFAQICVFLVET